MKKSWYVTHTKPRQESIADENLRRQRYATWLPLCQHRRHRSGKWVNSVEPLFPRYLFIQLALGSEDISPIRSTRGVSTLVRVNDLPAPVPESVVKDLMSLQDNSTGLIPLAQPSLSKGDNARITAGPFEGCVGKCLEKTSKERVIILLDILGKQNRVTVPEMAVAAVG